MDQCLATEKIQAYVAGRLLPDDQAVTDQHLAVCARCRHSVETLRREQALAGEIQQAYAAGTMTQPTEHVAKSPGDARIDEELSAARPIPHQVERIEGYEILREIHRGGQGVVYKAIQKATKRPVALKVLLQGPYASARQRHRFEREVDLVASLQHPNIVTVYDSGQTKDGRHYFAMEYIHGQPLDRFLSDKSLGIDETLRLFQKICAAVNYAHQRGVIHRDLKPGNILVDAAGEPHVVDFGLAKVAGPNFAESGMVTVTGEFMGTLAYASPEQTRGDPNLIDIRTDIYSLGVILYEMLTGKYPYPVIGQMADVLRHIAETEPTRPSTIRRQINDEVETIVLKALAKEKERRYQSAENLAKDVGHYLAGEPIDAKRDSGWYIIRKTLKRYRVPATIAAAFVALVTVSAMALGVMYRNQSRARLEAEQERQRADRQRANAELVADFMSNMLEGVKVAKALGRDTTMLREMLDAAARRVENGELKASPEAEMRLRWTIGGAYTDIAEGGAIQRAESILAPTLKLAEQTYGRESEQMAMSLSNLASCQVELGHPTDALPEQESALALRQRLFKGDHPDIAKNHNSVADCLAMAGRPADALVQNEAAIAMCQRLFKGDHPDLAQYLNDAGNNLYELGRTEESLLKYDASLAMRQRLIKGDHPDIVESLNNGAVGLASLGRSKEALPKYEAALEMGQRLIKGDHPTKAVWLGNVATCLNSLGRPAEALPKYEKALAMTERLFKGDHRDKALRLGDVATCLLSLDRPAEALPKYEAALAMTERLFNGDHRDVARGLHSLACCLGRLGRQAEALPKYEAALAMYQRIDKSDNPRVAQELMLLGYCLEELGRPGDALPKYEEALSMRQRLYKGDRQELAQSLGNLGHCFVLLGRPSEALPKIEAALAMNERGYKGDHPRVVADLVELGYCLTLLGRPDEALSRYEAGLAMNQRLFKGDHPAVAQNLLDLGICLMRIGRPADALPKYEMSLAMRQRLFNGDHPDVAWSLEDIGCCLETLGQPEQAMSKFETAWAMRQRLFKGDRPDLADSLSDMANCLALMDKADQALPKIEAALAMQRRLLPSDHADVLSSEDTLAIVLIKLKRFERAEAVLTRLQSVLEKSTVAAWETKKNVLIHLSDLYIARDAAEPGKGYDAKAAEWRAKLRDWQTTTQPAITHLTTSKKAA